MLETLKMKTNRDAGKWIGLFPSLNGTIAAKVSKGHELSNDCEVEEGNAEAVDCYIFLPVPGDCASFVPLRYGVLVVLWSGVVNMRLDGSFG